MITHGHRSKSNTVITNQKTMVKSFDFWKEKDNGPGTPISPREHNAKDKEKERDNINLKDALLITSKEKSSFGKDSHEFRGEPRRKGHSSALTIGKYNTNKHSTSREIATSPPSRITHAPSNNSFLTKPTSASNTSVHAANEIILEERLAKEARSRSQLEKSVK